jgi:hypothetical protein
LIVGLFIFSACFFWQAASPSYKSLLAARIIGGLGGGVVESMGPMIVVDLFPREYIGRAMSIYTWSLGAGTVFGPLISGYMAQGTNSWRYPYYLFGGVSILNLVAIVAMFPEPNMNILMRGTSRGVAEIVETGRDKAETLSHIEKSEGRGRGVSVSTAEIWYTRSFYSRIYHNHPPPNWLILFFTPWRVLLTPAVLLTVILFGIAISSTMATSIVVSVVLSEPPTLWDSATIGLFNIAVLMGLIVGVPFGGLLADRAVIRYARKTGNRKIEIPLLIASATALISPVGVILAGVGLERGWHWALIGLFWAMLNFVLTSACTIMISYSTVTYPQHAIDIGVMVNTIKNVLSGGLSFVTVNWWFESRARMFGTLGGLELGLLLLIIPLYIWGAKLAILSEKWVRGFEVY